MSVTAALTIAGLIGGGFYGLGSARNRANQYRTQFDYAERYSDAVEKNALAKRNILGGNLSIMALSNNIESKRNAIGEFQANSSQEEALGGSGLSSGTPFYKLATDVIDRREEVAASADIAARRFDQASLEAKAQDGMIDLDILAARQRLMDIGSEYAYADSPFAAIMGTFTGAMAGGKMGAEIATKGVSAGVIKEPLGGADPAAETGFFGSTSPGQPYGSGKTIFSTPLLDRAAFDKSLTPGMYDTSIGTYSPLVLAGNSVFDELKIAEWPQLENQFSPRAKSKSPYEGLLAF